MQNGSSLLPPVPWRQVGLLTFWSSAFLVPLLWLLGTNVCTVTFAEGATRLWNGANPYLAPDKGDVFHYSPFFALVYRPLASLPPFLHALTWTILNSFVFWLGVSAWYRFDWRRDPWSAIGWILCSMELDVSLRYQQTNAMMAGLCLLALAAMKRGWHGRAGFWVAVGMNFKIIPAVFGLGLLVPFRRRGLKIFFATTMTLIALPAVVVGPASALWLQSEQIRAIRTDLPGRKMLEINSVFERLGHPELGGVVWSLVAAGTLLLFPLVRILRRRSEEFPYLEWYGLAVTAALLLIPRTESPTFAWMAPLYLGLTVGLKRRQAWPVWVAGFFISFIYTSFWPSALRFAWQENWSTKSLGVLALWLLVVYRLVCGLRAGDRATKTSAPVGTAL